MALHYRWIIVVATLLAAAAYQPPAWAGCRDKPEAGVDWSGCDKERLILREQDLKGANLERTDLSESDLSEAQLNEALLQEAMLARARIWDADLRGAQLVKTLASRADFSRANLEGANLTKSEMSRAVLEKANLRGADMRKAELSRTHFAGADHKQGAIIDTAVQTSTSPMSHGPISPTRSWTVPISRVPTPI